MVPVDSFSKSLPQQRMVWQGLLSVLTGLACWKLVRVATRPSVRFARRKFPCHRSRVLPFGCVSTALFSLKVDDVGMNRRGVVQQVVILVLEVFVEEGERAGSYRLALRPRNGCRISRPCLVANQRASVLKTLMRRVLDLKPVGILDRVGEQEQRTMQPLGGVGRRCWLGRPRIRALAVHRKKRLLESKLIEVGWRLHDPPRVEQDDRFTARVDPTELRHRNGSRGESEGAQPLQVQSPGKQRVVEVEPA